LEAGNAPLSRAEEVRTLPKVAACSNPGMSACTCSLASTAAAAEDTRRSTNLPRPWMLGVQARPPPRTSASKLAPLLVSVRFLGSFCFDSCAKVGFATRAAPLFAILIRDVELLLEGNVLASSCVGTGVRVCCPSEREEKLTSDCNFSTAAFVLSYREGWILGF
jgi:hypothetical protein